MSFKIRWQAVSTLFLLTSLTDHEINRSNILKPTTKITPTRQRFKTLKSIHTWG